MNKKIKNIWTIVYFWFYSFWIIILSFLLYYKLLPDYNNIELLKSKAYSSYSEIKEIEVKWINFSDFRSSLPKEELTKSLFLDNLVKKITPDFYNRIFINDTDLDYDIYLTDLKKKYSNDSDYDKISSLISDILPVYSNLNLSLVQNDEALFNYFQNNSVMSDFKFINFLDVIIDSFRIQYSNLIWVSELVFLEEYSLWEVNSIHSDIFYVPILLDLNIRKDYFLDFLHYIENVWKISLDWEEIIFKELSNLDLLTIKDSKFYSKNIYNNILADVSILELPEYLDSLNSKYSDTTFVNYIKNTQWNQFIDAKIEIKFYVKWLPTYLIEWSLKKFIAKFDLIRSSLDEKLLDESLSEADILLLNNINNSMNEIYYDLIEKINEAFIEKGDLELIYVEAYNYNSILDEFLETINK